MDEWDEKSFPLTKAGGPHPQNHCIWQTSESQVRNDDKQSVRLACIAYCTIPREEMSASLGIVSFLPGALIKHASFWPFLAPLQSYFWSSSSLTFFVLRAEDTKKTIFVRFFLLCLHLSFGRSPQQKASHWLVTCWGTFGFEIWRSTTDLFHQVCFWRDRKCKTKTNSSLFVM